jgi:hypothetical protein|tara:strand:+ start:1482 stop:1718 length:237 start_codon:yes stop_codon:yes gene_type:complete
MVACYHHWTNQQLAHWKQYQQVMPTPFNPVGMAPVSYSEYPHLHRDMWSGEPDLNDRETPLEMRKTQECTGLEGSSCN